jgi:hypothetical protein
MGIGTTDDREEEHDGREPDCDDEPSPGALEWATTADVVKGDRSKRGPVRYREGDQSAWGAVDTTDRELDEDDEP